MRSTLRHLTRLVPVLGISLIAACSHDRLSEQPVPPSAAQTPSSSESVTATTTSVSPSPSEPPPPAEPEVCSDHDLTVANDEVSSANTLRRVVVSFTNTSADVCTLVGYPGADLVTGAGGVLVHVERRPANAAPRLTLHPGEVASADVQAYAIDAATGDPCPRIGTLAVTLPNGSQSHLLNASLPICSPTISAVG